MSTKAAVVAKPVFRSAARKRVTGRRELLFHFQNGASWSPVLSAADAAELCRRAHARHGQAFLVEHVAAMEEHNAEGLSCICWKNRGKAGFTDVLLIDQNTFHLSSVHFLQ